MLINKRWIFYPGRKFHKIIEFVITTSDERAKISIQKLWAKRLFFCCDVDFKVNYSWFHASLRLLLNCRLLYRPDIFISKSSLAITNDIDCYLKNLCSLFMFHRCRVFKSKFFDCSNDPSCNPERFFVEIITNWCNHNGWAWL